MCKAFSTNYACYGVISENQFCPLLMLKPALFPRVFGREYLQLKTSGTGYVTPALSFCANNHVTLVTV